MKELQSLLIACAIFLLILTGLYFFVYKPVTATLYKKGYDAAVNNIKHDTTFIPGTPYTVYVDTSFHSIKESPVIQDSSGNSLRFFSLFDTTIVSKDSLGKVKDSLAINTLVDIKINKDSISNLFKKAMVDWLVNIQHKSYEQKPDTIKINNVIKLLADTIPFYRTDVFAYVVSGITFIATLFLIH